MFERILVPLDGSPVSEAALPVVEELVSKLSSVQRVEVTLIRVVTSLTHWVAAGEEVAPVPCSDQEINLIRKEAQAYLDGAIERLRNKPASVKIRVSVGNSAQEIIKACEEIAADLIIMVPHGRTGLARWVFGSVTERVLRAGGGGGAGPPGKVSPKNEDVTGKQPTVTGRKCCWRRCGYCRTPIFAALSIAIRSETTAGREQRTP